MNQKQVSDTWERGSPYERYVGRWSRLVAIELVDWLSVPAGAAWPLSPTPLVRFDWGSTSTRRTRRSAMAREDARLMAVVVFPTPPFWLATAIECAGIIRLFDQVIRPNYGVVAFRIRRAG